MMHADTKRLQTALTGQGIVDCHKDGLRRQQRFQHTKHRQPQGVQRPTGFGEKSMKSRMMTLACDARGRKDSCDGLLRLANTQPARIVTKFRNDGTVITTANSCNTTANELTTDTRASWTMMDCLPKSIVREASPFGQ